MTLVQQTPSTSRYPADWPGPGPIDLEIHDLPHASSTLEWWYTNCHLTTESGEDLSLFASFFRTAVDQDERTGEYTYAHALAWAIVDPRRRRYLAESLVDKDAPTIVRQRLARGEAIKDPLIRRAMLEVVEKGNVSRPDTLLRAPAKVGRDRLELDLDGRRFERISPDTYQLTLEHGERSVGCSLRFKLEKPIIRHGVDGIVHGKSGEEMFYYFSPRCLVEGTVIVDGEPIRVQPGVGWYDHEFGRLFQARQGDSVSEHIAPLGPRNVSWEWMSALFENGSDLTTQCLFDDATGESLGQFAVIVDPEGNADRYEDFGWQGSGYWTSSKTFVRYPSAWTLEIPAARTLLQIQADFEAQELLTSIARPSFWEGRVHLEGRIGDTDVRGVGFVERTGFDSAETVDDFFAAVGSETQRSIRKVLPAELDASSAAHLIAGEERAGLLDDVELGQLSRTLIRPIRTIVDRGGKAWRSYILLACCDAVGGDSQPLLELLALPELVHVGSLMVDDVQDGSSVRRGGPAAHHLFGEAIAINAGCMSYFLPELFVNRLDLSDHDKLRIYGLYFEAVRAAHAGQALDLDGFADKMPLVVEQGDGALVERHVLAVHRLKSAVPAGCLARAGAILGGGGEDEVAAVGELVSGFGLAFQIVDDVLNLEGFERNLKSRGEDLAVGKVTVPIAKAMSRLDVSARRQLWSILESKSADPYRIGQAIRLLESCGALAACRAEAEVLVEDAWARFDPVLPDSHAKLMLRVFGWQVLRRTY